MVAVLDTLLNAKNESEFFITMCALLKSYHRPGIKASNELKVNATTPRPNLETSLFMVLGQKASNGTVGYNRRKVWTFTLYADGELSWEAFHFNSVELGIYTDCHRTYTVGLEEIKRVLKETKGIFTQGQLSDNIHAA